MNPISDIPTITTERLLLRPFTEADAGPLHHILGQEGVLRYFPRPDPPGLDQVQRLVAAQLRHWQEHGFGWWAVVPRDGAVQPAAPSLPSSPPGLIGWNGLQYLPDTDEIEIGYLLDRDYWGQGLAAEGARAGLRFGFAQLQIERIILVVHVDNFASQRVADKLGMALDIRAEYFGMDCYRYVLRRKEWLERNRNG